MNKLQFEINLKEQDKNNLISSVKLALELIEQGYNTKQTSQWLKLAQNQLTKSLFIIGAEIDYIVDIIDNRTIAKDQKQMSTF